MKDNFQLKIEGNLENRSYIGDFAAGCMKEFGLDAHKTFQVQMAVDEACTNIIKYGNHNFNHILKLDIICKRKNKKIFVTIEDNGINFNLLKVAPLDLNATLEDRKVGGLGIHFIRTLMDKIEYERKSRKNVLTMVIDVHER